jgi:hypothetical protein
LPVGAGMRRISMTTRDELVVALAGRYALGSRAERVNDFETAGLGI